MIHTPAVFSTPVDPGCTPDPNDVRPNILEWLLGNLGTLGAAVSPEGFRKTVITGEDLDVLQPVLAQATEITVWTFGDHKYNLYFRPLLPGETEQTTLSRQDGGRGRAYPRAPGLPRASLSGCMSHSETALP